MRGKKIKKIRKACGMTQLQLSNETGVSQSYISMIENGTSEPSEFVYRKIMNLLKDAYAYGSND